MANYSHTQHLRDNQIRSTNCGYHDCTISTPTYTLGHSYKETLTKKRSQTSATRMSAASVPIPPRDSVATTVVNTSFPLLIALDSLGGVNCTRLTLATTPVSCSAKVVASHISGVISPILSQLTFLLGSTDHRPLSLWKLSCDWILIFFGSNF